MKENPKISNESLKYYKEIKKLKKQTQKAKKIKISSTTIGILIFLGLIIFAFFSVPILKTINQNLLNSIVSDKTIEELVPAIWGIILIITFITNLIINTKNNVSSTIEDDENEKKHFNKIITENLEDNSIPIENPEVYGYSCASDSSYNEQFLIDERNSLND